MLGDSIMRRIRRAKFSAARGVLNTVFDRNAAGLPSSMISMADSLRVGAIVVGLLAAAGAVGCAPATVREASSLDGVRARALDAVAHPSGGAEDGAVVSHGVVFSRTPAGAIRGVPLEHKPGAPRDDIAIEAELRGRVARDPKLAAYDVDIDVDHGVVRLGGNVPDALHAARIIDLALAIPGVRAVESSLAWVSRSDVERLSVSATR